MKVVCLWSAGKDSCLAACDAIAQGHTVKALFNFTEMDGHNSLSHGLKAAVIHRQAALTGIPFFQKAMPKGTYRDEFKALIEHWKKSEGIEGIVFGDIFLQEHKEWIDSVCKELDVVAVMPLWGRDTSVLIDEFIKKGFKAIVVAVKADVMSGEWLGREIDEKFVSDIKAAGMIDPCGEKGEYHTFVYDGPIFKRRVDFKRGERTAGSGTFFLEIA